MFASSDSGKPNQPLGRGLGSLIPRRSSPAPASTPLTPRPAPRVVTENPQPVPPSTPTKPLPTTDEVRARVGATAPTPRREGRAAPRLLDIPGELIDPNPHQPRRSFQTEPFDDLVRSIRQHGIIQPLVVTKNGERYELIAGERRLRAAKQVGLATVPAVVRETEELEQLELAIVENVQRQDLNPIEEAQAYQQLIDEFGLTQEAIAEKVGKSRATVANILRLLTLPAEILAALREGKISASHGKILLAAVTPHEREKLFRQIMHEQLPVRAAGTLSRATTVRRHTRRKTDPVILAAEDELRNRFGTRVTISKRDQRGSVSIEFYSDEEYLNLLNRLRTM